MAAQITLQFVTAFTSVILDHSVAPIGRQIGYVFNYKSNLQSLKKQLQKLKDERDMVQHSVDDATRKGEEIEAAVARWMKYADKIIEDAEEIVSEGEEFARKGWFRRSCIGLRSRYRAGKGAAKESKSVVKLQEEGKFDKVSYRGLPQGIWITASKGYEAFESRKHTMNGITETLKDPNVNMVGVYGMGGVGKTTLVKEVAKKAKQDGIFNMVVMAEVSQRKDIKKIQGEIADKLGLEFREESVSGRADRLCDRLKKEKRILVILDNLWERLDLEEVGIPFGEAHPGCKILLTSRDHNVLSCGMNSHKNFAVGILQENEAWELFKNITGDIVESSELQSTATEVVRECAGLPIAIVSVAGALKNKSLPLWKNALRELTRPSSRNFTGMQAVVYSTIELSYNHLESEELKSTFLLCAAMGSPMIIDLLKYGIGLGLFQHTDTVEEAQDRVHTLLSNLEASGLLLEASNSKEFAIHDVVRDVAVSVAARDWHMFAVLRNVVRPKDWPNADCTGISLFYNDIREFPEELECPRLKFFYIGNKDPSLSIPDNFFAETKELRVLDLTEVNLSSIPPSIHQLANLRTLCLDHCVLGDINIIGKLKKLEILSLVESNVEQLPMDLGQLTRLQLLDLSNCSKLRLIPAGIMSNLSRLEQLYMGNSFNRWDTEDLDNQASNISLSELRHLPQLTVLEIHIPDAQVTLKDLFSEELDRFTIFIGDVSDWTAKYETSRTLKLKSCTSLQWDDGICKLLKKTEDLYLDEMQDGGSILWELDKEGFPRLKHLHLNNSPKIRYIVNSMEEPWFSSNAFPVLESLFVQNLINLEKICHGKLRVGCFSKLRKVKVGNCQKLERLFPLSVFKSLLQLEEIEITDCENIAGIVTEERVVPSVDNETSEIELRQLRSLTLQNLQKLVSFHYKEQLSPTFQSRTSNSMLLLDEKILFHSLEDLKLSSVNIAKIWPDQSSAVASCLKKLKTLTLEGCDNLKYVFSSSMVKNILQLKTLVVRDCKSVEKIIVTERLHDERNMNELFFPELYDLRLENLPQLTGFCARSLTDFPSLRWLVIKKCPELESFTSNTARDQRILAAESQREAIPLFNEKVKLPNLERLLIEEMDNLEKLWNSQLSPDAFSKLDYFAVWNCKKLLTVFPSNMINRLQRLDRMRVHLCPSLKSIFEPLGAEHPESRSAIPKFVFPQVTVLEIWDIPELRSIYPGMHTTEWPLLKRMHLHGCDKVNVFASGAPWFLQTQRGEQTEISNQQPLFLVDEETFPNLEELKLQRIDAITEIWHGKFSAAYLCKLKVLELTDFLKRPILPSLSFIQLLPALEKLNISEAPFESIFQSRECARDEMLAGRLTKLSELKLSKLPDLKHLLKEEDEPGLVLPCLRPEQVESITFKNLTVLEVSKCGRLVSLVRQCTARSLVQLQKLRISDCEMIEGIIVYLGGEVKDGIVLKKLKSLELHCLPSLGSFCFGDYPLEFPSLEEVIIRGCPRMKFFSQGALSTPNLQRVQLTEGDNEGNWNGDLNTTIKQMSSEMVGYNSLEHLKLSMFPELVEMWSRSPSIPFNFKTLKFLEVQNCNNLRYLMCPSMIHSLDQLEELKIENCALMENVITAEDAGEITGVKLAFPLLNSISLESLPNLTSFCLGSNDLECLSLEKITIRNCPKLITFSSVFLKEQDLGVTGDGNIESSSNGDADNPVTSLFREKAVLPKLKEVVISHIDNLEQIWNNYISATSLSELKIVKVQNCPKLSTVFPAVAARSLLQLEQLLIGYCGVEYIVSKLEGDETAFLNFVFPQVSSVELRTLPELKSFYPSKHTTEWPKLKRLDVYHCEKLWLYSPEYAIQSYEDGRLNVPDLQMPLVLVEKVLPNLETMSLKEEDIAMISYSNISPADLFRKAKFLLVQCFHGESAVVPLDFLERIHDVEKLGIGCSYFPELIPYRGGGKYTGIFTRIRNLRLDTLPWIQHVGIRGSQFESALQNLEILEVWFCDGLTSLTPSSVSFPNLKSLDIWQCKSLKTLVTFSAARRLVQLTEMRIRESGMLREMISTEGGEPEEEIVFGKLRCIELDDLSSLYCFCSSNCRLKFPALEEMIVNKCYGFVIFCKGVLSTPLLSRVWLKTEYDEWRWEGDLNATVNILYQERLAAGTSDRRHIQ